MDTLILNGSDLSLETLYQVVFERRKVEIAPEALERAEKARQVLFDMAKKGVAVIVISSDLPEVMAVSDRIITLSEGRVTGEIHGDDANEERLMTMMAINHNALMRHNGVIHDADYF